MHEGKSGNFFFVFPNERFDVVDRNSFFKKILRIHTGSEEIWNYREYRVNLANAPSIVPVAPMPAEVPKLVCFVNFHTNIFYFKIILVWNTPSIFILMSENLLLMAVSYDTILNVFEKVQR